MTFRIRDIHHPCPNDILLVLYGDDTISGDVLCVQDCGEDGKFVVVHSARYHERLIVRCERVTPPPPDWPCRE